MPAPSSLLDHVGQSNHYLLQFWDQLTANEQKAFEEQLLNVDFEKSKEAFEDSAHVVAPPQSDLSPIDDSRHIVKNEARNEWRKHYSAGLKAISEGQVAVVVLAGGQASRLGSDKPKGMVELGVHVSSHDSLFGMQAAKIARLQRVASGHFPDKVPIIPWIVMTSASTDATTKEYLAEVIKDNRLTDVSFICQDEMPAFDMNGRFLLADKHKLATAPNGNGGLYSVLSGELENLEKKGVKYVHVYCVDNILVKVADPYFVGLAVDKGADCVAKAVKREDPKEKVGVICLNKGRPAVVEYSELGELADLSLPDGRLAYRAGNIANHLFSLDFLKSFCTRDFHLPYHRALKKIAYVDGHGKLVKTTENNGIKLEQFIFDVFSRSENFYIVEVERDEEFSPLKNPDSVGKECLSTCRKDLERLHTSWLVSIGAKVDPNEWHVVKASRSYDGEGLDEFLGENNIPRVVS